MQTITVIHTLSKEVCALRGLPFGTILSTQMSLEGYLNQSQHDLASHLYPKPSIKLDGKLTHPILR